MYQVTRTCSSKSRHPDRYTKSDLTRLFSDMGMSSHGLTIDEMCDFLNTTNAVGKQFAPVSYNKVQNLKKRVTDGAEDFYTTNKRIDELALRLSVGDGPGNLAVPDYERRRLLQKLRQQASSPRVMGLVTPYVRYT